MATSNFGTPKFGLPLVAVGDIRDEDGEVLEDESNWNYISIEHEVAEFNKETVYLELEVKSGYYEGCWFDIKETNDYWDYEQLDELTDEDADYFFGDTAEQVRKDYAEDMKKIRAELKKLVDEWGALELGVAYRFSNGETGYNVVKESAL